MYTHTHVNNTNNNHSMDVPGRRPASSPRCPVASRKQYIMIQLITTMLLLLLLLIIMIMTKYYITK